MNASDQKVARNEPCPCGSGKKYKRCHGVDADPILGTKTAANTPSESPPGGVDPSQFDPALLQQVGQWMNRLPKGQIAKIQNLMEKAMHGKDVSQEAQALEQSLPPEFLSLMSQFQPPATDSAANAEITNEMTEEQARAIVEQAAKEGKVSEEEATAVLGEKRKWGFWKK